MAYLQVQGLGKAYGAGLERREVLRDVSFEVRSGEILALLGASGCGKTTLLNIVAGFLEPDAGAIKVQGVPSRNPGPDKAVIFQDDALFPWLTVEENVSFGLRVNSVSGNRRRDIARRMLELVGLAGREKHLPGQLSGGMRQRVALARVLALEPRLLLMDEPFAALDALTREEMHDLLLALHADFQPAVVFVTHDVVEAVKLADQVLVMGGNSIHDRERINLERPRETEAEPFLEYVRKLRGALRQVFEHDQDNGHSKEKTWPHTTTTSP
ncbi:ABC transporter ATP-binding protein [Desulfonatronum thiosulfatophilum]|nr:ABC transporter ATP-binding protein [Desulfonatronum thiosulfatophilum]